MSNQVHEIFVGVIGITLINLLKVIISNNVVPNTIEQGDKPLVLLAIDRFEFDEKEVGCSQGLALKEVTSIVKIIENLTITPIDYRRKLLDISNHHDLNASEWTFNMPDGSKARVNVVKQVSTNHGDLIDDENFKTVDPFSLSLSKPS